MKVIRHEDLLGPKFPSKARESLRDGSLKQCYVLRTLDY